MFIKYGRKVLTLVAVLVMLWIALPTVAQEKPTSKDKVAVVNGTVITQDQFEREVGGAQQRIASRGQRLNDLELQAMKKDILENMINSELLFQESKKLGVTVEEVAIDEQLKKLKGRFPNEEEFKRALTLLNLSEGDLKTEIERGLAIQQLVDTQVGGKIAVSDEEVKTYYNSHPEAFRRPEEVRASHILILVESGADEPKKALARQKLEQVQEKLKKGEDFTTLAKEYSEGPSRAKGGDLGYFRRGQMVKSFEDVAFALKPGEVSGLVETKFGYHLIKVIDKKPETVIAFVDVKDKLQQFLKQKKVEGQVGQYVEGLKEKATIGRFLSEAN